MPLGGVRKLEETILKPHRPALEPSFPKPCFLQDVAELMRTGFGLAEPGLIEFAENGPDASFPEQPSGSSAA